MNNLNFDQVKEIIVNYYILLHKIEPQTKKLKNKILTYKDSDGYWEKYTYDYNGNRLSEKDSEGRRKKFTYDNKGNLLTVKEIYFKI